MSENRITTGLMARLKQPVGDCRGAEHQALEDMLYAKGSKLTLNYTGELIVYIHTDKPSYEESLIFTDSGDMGEGLEKELEKVNIQVTEETPKAFVCHWYDGVDPPHLDLSPATAGFA